MSKENKNSAARIQANNRYNAKAYDRINIAIPKGQKTAVEAHARNKGESVNGLVNSLLRAEMGLTPDQWRNPPEDADGE